MQHTIVVVPAYREALVVADVVRELSEAFDEVVVVDDGSDDQTAEAAATAGATVLRHLLNRGQGAALETGFTFVRRHRQVRYVVTFDADGQHLVSDAVQMVSHAETEGIDVVLASRFLGEARDIPTSRRLLLGAAVRLSRRTTGLELTDTNNGLRVLSRRALDTLSLRCSGMAHASELEAAIARSGLSWAELPATVLYTEYARAKGQRASSAVNILFELALRRLGQAA